MKTKESKKFLSTHLWKETQMSPSVKKSFACFVYNNLNDILFYELMPTLQAVCGEQSVAYVSAQILSL